MANGKGQQWGVNALAQAHAAFVEDGEKTKVFSSSAIPQTQLCLKPALSSGTARAKEINPSSSLGHCGHCPMIDKLLLTSLCPGFCLESLGSSSNEKQNQTKR